MAQNQTKGVELVALDEEQSALIANANALTVENQHDYEMAGEYRSKVLAEGIARVKSHFAEIKGKAHAAWKAIVAQEKSYLGPLEEAKQIVGGKMLAWRREEQERQRKEHEERMAEERRRQEEEAIRRAKELEERGQKTAADELLDRAVAAPVVAPPPPPPPTAENTSVRVDWKFEIVDMAKVSAEFLVPDEKKIGALVRQLGDKAQNMVGEGVRIYRHETLVTRRS